MFPTPGVAVVLGDSCPGGSCPAAVVRVALVQVVVVRIPKFWYQFDQFCQVFFKVFFGSLELKIGSIESKKIIIGSLKSEKLGSLQVHTGYLTFSLKKTLILLILIVTTGISKRQNFGNKKYCQSNWQIFWKTVIFGSICQIWHHLATLAKSCAISFENQIR